MCGGIMRPAFLLFFPCEAVASVRQTRPEKSRKGDRPPAPGFYQPGRLPSQQASQTRDGVWAGHVSTGMAWTEKAGHEDERGKRKA
jgi:hypothetical protein